MATFSVHDKVFAKVKGYTPWPAIIKKVVKGPQPKYLVRFYGTNQIATVKPENLYLYFENRHKFWNASKKPTFVAAIAEIEDSVTKAPPLKCSKLSSPSSSKVVLKKSTLAKTSKNSSKQQQRNVKKTPSAKSLSSKAEAVVARKLLAQAKQADTTKSQKSRNLQFKKQVTKKTSTVSSKLSASLSKQHTTVKLRKGTQSRNKKQITTTKSSAVLKKRVSVQAKKAISSLPIKTKSSKFVKGFALTDGKRLPVSPVRKVNVSVKKSKNQNVLQPKSALSKKSALVSPRKSNKTKSQKFMKSQALKKSTPVSKKLVQPSIMKLALSQSRKSSSSSSSLKSRSVVLSKDTLKKPKTGGGDSSSRLSKSLKLDRKVIKHKKVVKVPVSKSRHTIKPRSLKIFKQLNAGSMRPRKNLKKSNISAKGKVNVSEKSKARARIEELSDYGSEGETSEEGSAVASSCHPPYKCLYATNPENLEYKIEMGRDVRMFFKSPDLQEKLMTAACKEAEGLRDDIEFGMVRPIPDKRLKRYAESLNPAQLERKATEEKKESMIWFITEAKILECDQLIMESLNKYYPNLKRCVKALNVLESLDVQCLMLKKYPHIITTLKDISFYTGKSSRLELTIKENEQFQQDAKKIRKKAKTILDMFEALFNIPDGMEFHREFPSILENFRKATSNMSKQEKCLLTEDPTVKKRRVRNTTNSARSSQRNGENILDPSTVTRNGDTSSDEDIIELASVSRDVGTLPDDNVDMVAEPLVSASVPDYGEDAQPSGSRSVVSLPREEDVINAATLVPTAEATSNEEKENIKERCENPLKVIP